MYGFAKGEWRRQLDSPHGQSNRRADIILLSQKVAAVVAENQIIEEIQILACGGPDESQARQGQRSSDCGVC
jgi:hypothetical protein